jgi:hypothetical protein
MRNLSSRTDLYLQTSQINESPKNGHDRPFRDPAFNTSGLVWIISIITAVLLSTHPTFGQFSVQPMKMELAVTPNKHIKSTLDIKSHDPNEVYTIDLSLHELTQSENAVWQVIDPNSNFDLSKLSSCSDWISLSKDVIDLGPMVGETIIVDIKVPRNVRGFYAAAIIASVRPRPGTSREVAVNLQFLIPVIVEIQSRSVRHKITVGDVGMEFVPQSGERPATVLATIDIENNGGTYSRLKPFARIWNFSNGHWRVITTTTFNDASIIPGVKLKLKHDIGRSLPSGKYRVSGALYVDGGRIRGVQKELDFAGDTSLKDAASDVPLDLIPRDITIESIPGATRLSTIKVHNATEETVHVQAAKGLPYTLQNKVVQDLNGNDLDCTDWITVTPENFTLPGYGQQNLMITSKMPSPGIMYPCYYSLLALWVTYPDGQKAGVATANICLENSEVQAKPLVQPLLLKTNHLGESDYLVVAKFANFGTTHFTPIRCGAIVATGLGEYKQTALLTSQEAGLMLPLDVRMFNGKIDFSAVPAGEYRLAVGLEYAPGEVAQKQIGIRVSTEGDYKLVETIQMEEELPQRIEIQW